MLALMMALAAVPCAAPAQEARPEGFTVFAPLETDMTRVFGGQLATIGDFHIRAGDRLWFEDGAYAFDTLYLSMQAVIGFPRRLQLSVGNGPRGPLEQAFDFSAAGRNGPLRIDQIGGKRKIYRACVDRVPTGTFIKARRLVLSDTGNSPFRPASQLSLEAFQTCRRIAPQFLLNIGGERYTRYFERESRKAGVAPLDILAE